MTRLSIPELGTILGVWAHPDDEAYSSAGIMALAAANGQRVVCVTATHGEAGFPGDDTRTPEQRKAVRDNELAACLDILGVTEHSYLDYADGGCNQADDTAAAQIIAGIVAGVRPDTLLTFAPDGGTGHPDHISLCRWSTLALEQLRAAGHPVPRLLYSAKSAEWSEQFTAGRDMSAIMMSDDVEPATLPVAQMALHLHCDDELADRKLAALRAQASQVESFIAGIGVDAYRELFRDEFFRDPEPDDTDLLIRSKTWTYRT